MPNKITNAVLFEKICNMREDIEEWKNEIKIRVSNHEDRLHKLEDWKLIFVTKFTVYSAIAVFIGTLLGGVLSALIIAYAKKHFGL